MPRSAGHRSPTELPTLAVAAAVHIGWLGWTYGSASLPWWAAAPIGGLLVAWHGSLQHETIHGHPTRWRGVNALIGSLPIALWLPYGVYRAQHLEHHGAPALTDPAGDPESFYVSSEEWAAAGSLRRAWLRSQMTALGRLVFGPLAVVARFFAAEVARLVRGDRRHLRAWAAHAVGVALVAAWLLFVCHLPLWRYLVCFVYPGLAVTLLRSFAEHRPAAHEAHRIAIVESGLLGRLLYLNNNFHVVHHSAPAAPWYELEARYRAERTRILEENGGYVFPGYLRILARYAFSAKDSPVHPATAEERRAA